MMYVQVLQEIEVDEESIIEQNRDDWDAFLSDDVAEFLDYLVSMNVIAVSDLGEVAHQSVMPI